MKTRDGLRIAYSTAGDGPPLVFVRALNSHAQESWAEGWTAAYFGALATGFSVVLIDSRGNGLSGATTEIELDLLVEDVRAVVEDAELDGVTLFGQGFGSPVAIAFVARHPDRVARLILYCAYARGAATIITNRFIETMRKMPEAAAAFMGRETYPDDPDLPTRLLSVESMHVPPETAAAYFEFARRVDVEAELPSVCVPTLVMQPESNPQVRSSLGKEVVAGIPGAEFVSIPGGAYNPYARKSFQPTLRAIGDFVGMQLVDASQPVVLLLTDIVASTAMTQRVGETIARELHELHDDIVGDVVELHGGTVVQHKGDGMMTTFTSAVGALECAAEIQRRLAGRNREAAEQLHVRIGLATGDAYVHDGQPFTSAAQLVTRVTERGGPGQVWASDAVRELAPDFGFGPARSVGLKGFDGRARLFPVRWSDGSS